MTGLPEPSLPHFVSVPVLAGCIYRYSYDVHSMYRVLSYYGVVCGPAVVAGWLWGPNVGLLALVTCVGVGVVVVIVQGRMLLRRLDRSWAGQDKEES